MSNLFFLQETKTESRRSSIMETKQGVTVNIIIIVIKSPADLFELYTNVNCYQPCFNFMGLI